MSRTTVAFDPDVAAEIQRLRRDRGVGVSAVVNDLIRRGLNTPATVTRFEQRASPMGARVDLTNIADLLETLGGPATR